MSHFIKLGLQKDIEVQLSKNNVDYKQNIVFVVNDCKGDLDSGEGSHWSLLVYERASNTWYHMDSNNGYNEPHAKQIIGKVNNYLASIGSLLNLRTKYIESHCTQQTNGYDCGPLMILFARNTAKKIIRVEPLHTYLVNKLKQLTSESGYMTS